MDKNDRFWQRDSVRGLLSADPTFTPSNKGVQGPSLPVNIRIPNELIGQAGLLGSANFEASSAKSAPKAETQTPRPIHKGPGAKLSDLLNREAVKQARAACAGQVAFAAAG